jgi:hypothetical protein
MDGRFIKEDKDYKSKLNDYYMCYRDNVILFP